MKRLLRTPLFRPTYRLLGLCVVVGVAGGLAAILFDLLVDFAQSALLGEIGGYRPPEPGVLNPESVVPEGRRRWWLPLVTTLGGLASGWVVWRFCREAEGSGADQAIAAYHEEAGSVRARVPVLKAIASALTLGSGGVAGREGPMAQISVGIGAIVGRLARVRGQRRRTLLLASMAAGLSAMFRAPLGMAIFTVEVLYSGLVFESEALIFTVIAAVTAYAVYGFFAGWESLFAIPAELDFQHPQTLVVFALLGIAAGVLAAMLPALIEGVRRLFARLPGPAWLRPGFGGLAVGLLALLFPQLLGTGYGWLELAMTEQLTLGFVLAMLLLKGPAMALTVGSGGSGGVFGPTITLGGMLGATVGILYASAGGGGMPLAAFVVVGMAAVFASAARAPISTLIMVVEMTGGYGLIVPAMLANVLSFITQGTIARRFGTPRLYPAQVPSRELSPLHRGVFVRRALDMIEREQVKASEIKLPRLMSLLRYGAPIPIADDATQLTAIAVEPGSSLDGTTIADGVGVIEEATVVAVLRDTEMLVPRGATEIQHGDRLLIVARPTAYAVLLDAARSR